MPARTPGSASPGRPASPGTAGTAGAAARAVQRLRHDNGAWSRPGRPVGLGPAPPSPAVCGPAAAGTPTPAPGPRPWRRPTHAGDRPSQPAIHRLHGRPSAVTRANGPVVSNPSTVAARSGDAGKWAGGQGLDGGSRPRQRWQGLPRLQPGQGPAGHTRRGAGRAARRGSAGGAMSVDDRRSARAGYVMTTVRPAVRPTGRRLRPTPGGCTPGSGAAAPATAARPSGPPPAPAPPAWALDRWPWSAEHPSHQHALAGRLAFCIADIVV